MKIGDRILVAHDLSDPTTLREYTVTKVGKDTVQCGSSENTFYIAMVWPFSVKDELLSIMNCRAALKRQYDDSMKLVYELKNAIARGERS